VVVVVDVIMHARFERINAIAPFEMEVLGFQGAEEAFNRRDIEAVALAAHALLDSASHEHRSVGLHLVVPTLVGMHAQAGDAIDPRERGLKYAGNHLEDRPSCHAIRDDIAVVQVHEGRQVELLSAYIELGDIGRPFSGPARSRRSHAAERWKRASRSCPGHARSASSPGSTHIAPSFASDAARTCG